MKSQARQTNDEGYKLDSHYYNAGDYEQPPPNTNQGRSAYSIADKQYMPTSRPETQFSQKNHDSEFIPTLGVKRLITVLGDLPCWEMTDMGKKEVLLRDFLDAGSAQYPGGCLLLFLKRFGSRTSRATAAEISELKNVLEEMGIRLVAIGQGLDGWEEFIRGDYFAGDVLTDSNGVMAGMLHLQKICKLSNFKFIFHIIIKNELKIFLYKLASWHKYGLMALRNYKLKYHAQCELFAKYPEIKASQSDEGGDADLLGGVFVLDPTMTDLVFSYREMYKGDRPPIASIVATLNGEY